MSQIGKRVRSRKFRNNSRYNVYLTVSLLKDGSTKERPLGEGDAFDLSPEGCQMVSEIALEQGAYVSLHLSLPGQEVPVRINVAAVRWVRDGKVGLEFVSMSAQDRDRLDEFVAYLNRVAK